MIFLGKTYVSQYYLQWSHPLMNLGVKFDLCVPFVHSEKVRIANLSEPTVQFIALTNTLSQKVVVTNPKKDSMGSNGVNLTL